MPTDRAREHWADTSNPNHPDYVDPEPAVQWGEGFKFVMTPHDLVDAVEDGDISIAAMALWVVLGTYADNQTHKCFPGQKRLAETLGYTERHIRRLIAELELAGFITLRRRGFGQTNIYVLCNRP